MAPADPLKSLISSLKDCSSSRIGLIICPDVIRRQRVTEHIAQAISTNAERINLDGGGISEDHLKRSFFSMQNMSLFSSETVVVLENSDALNAQLTKATLALLEELAPKTIVLLLACKLPANSTLLKYFTARERMFSLGELQGSELERWIAKELTQQGIKNPPQSVCSAIRLASHESADEAYAIVEKLSLYCDSETVSLEDLRALVPLESQVDEFDFISKISSAPRAQLELMVQQLLNQGVSPFPLLALLHKNFSSYYGLKALAASQANDDQKSQMLGMPTWLIKKLLPLSNRYSLQQLEIALASIVRADGLLKNRSLGSEAILGELMESLTP